MEVVKGKAGAALEVSKGDAGDAGAAVEVESEGQAGAAVVVVGK